MRLPQFAEDARIGYIKQIKMKTGTLEQGRTKKKSKSSFRMKSKSIETKTTIEKNLGMINFIVFNAM